MKSLARATLVIATVVAVCFALLQLGGRVLFSQLPRFEVAISALLGPDVVIEGLEGRWRGLNPGIFAERVRFGAGELLGFDFELDTIESLGRNRLVARRMTVADGRLEFEKTGSGWQLAGASAGPGFDAVALFAHSDEVWIRGRLFAREGRRTAALYIESWLINVSDGHRFAVRVQSEPNCTDCALVVEGDITSGGPGAVRVRASSFSLGSELDDMLGMPPFEVALDGDWRRRLPGSGQARLAIEATRIGTPGAEASLTATLGAWADGGGYRGSIDTLSIVSGDHSIDLGGAGFYVPGDMAGIFADVWLPEFAAEDVAALTRSAYGLDHPLGRWLHNLAPQGRIDGFRVRVDANGPAFACRGRNVAVSSFQSVPSASNVTFVAEGHAEAVRLTVDGYDLDVALPDFVAADETYLRGGGSLFFSFVSGNLGVRGERLWLDRGDTRVVGDLAVSQPRGSERVTLAVDAEIDGITFDEARGYLPLTLSPGLRSWLGTNVDVGSLEDVRLVFRGDFGTGAMASDRHFEMTANVVGGVVTYHPDWPTASDVQAQLAVAGGSTRLRGSAKVLGMDVEDVELRVPQPGNDMSLRVRTRADAGQLFDFVRKSPLLDAMPFVSETWTGEGVVAVAAEMDLPLASVGDVGLLPRDLGVEFGLEGVSIDLVDLGLRFDALTERVRYDWPRRLTGERLAGSLFGAPVRIGIESDDGEISFALEGSANVADVYGLLNLADPEVAEGRFDFDAEFEVFPGLERPAELRIESDLKGVSATLPAPLGKTRGQSRDLAVSLQFLNDYVAVSARYDDLPGVGMAGEGANPGQGETKRTAAHAAFGGWLHVGDNGIMAAALGLGVPAPMVDADRGRIVVSGGVDVVDAALIASVFGAAGGDSVAAWELRDFRIGRIELDALELADLHIDGHSDGGEVSLTLASENLHGTLARSGDAPWRLHLEELKLPAGDDDVALAPTVIDQLIAADVTLGKVTVGEKDFGSWRFGLRPVPQGIELRNVVAELRGLVIESTAPALWSRDGTTRFEGTVKAGDLREVLPLWDFVASVETESFAADGRLQWPGSPVEFDLRSLSGTASLDLTTGRFLDVEQGAGASRILSLINFSTIVKRISLDFTDVFGRGVSFDRVLADLSVADGLARFVTPAKINGTGLRFEIDGTVDFASGALDNTMTVTLPLHASLPWYAAFLATTNPLAAAGVLFGQQVLKDPIRRLASFDVEVRGTYDDPEVITLAGASTPTAGSRGSVADDGTTPAGEEEKQQ